MVAGGALVGQEAGVRRVEGLVTGAHSAGEALVLRGEPGVGKSALLGVARRSAEAAGMTVLATAGVQSEMHLPFAGLHQLLLPILDGATRLPPPQRAAVHGAFAPVSEGTPGLFPVALAVLDLLGDAADRAPVLVEVDDAQWLDAATADVLAFVARRLGAERVAMLIGLRDGVATVFDDAGLSEFRVERLDDDAAATLLDRGAPDLPPAARRLVLAEAAGNPLALVELPVAWRAGDREPLPLTARLERAFAQRASELPEPTQGLLLVAALDDAGRLAEVLAAGARLDPPAGEGDWEPAARAGLVEVDVAGVRFRHPLVRSAIRQRASAPQRRAAHTALAEALDGDPDRRVWHRAASLVAPDAGVSRDLADAAAAFRRRGSAGMALAALESAARLSPEPDRGGRYLDAAEAAFEAGRHDAGVALLREAEQSDLATTDGPRLAWLRELYEAGTWTGAGRIPAFVDVAERMRQQGDTQRAMDTLVTVALRCYWSNAGAATRALVVEAAERLPVADDDPRLIAVLGLAAPVERGAVVVERLAGVRADGHPEALEMLGLTATGVGAVADAQRLLEAAVAGLRARGRMGALARALSSRAWAAVFGNAYDVATTAAEEAERLAEETGQERWAATARALAAVVAGARGDEERSAALASSAERELLRGGANPLLAIVQHARGVAALASGRHADAYDELRRVFDPRDPAHHLYTRFAAVGDLTEAAVHAGRQGEARALVGELEVLVEASGSVLLGANLAYARPLLAPDDEAEALYQAGLSGDLTASPFLRARLLLAYGTWLRRRRRVAESRAPLRAARGMFDGLGTAPWSERARTELRASGETSRQRAPGVLDRLTPQELQIAQLAAQGLSNREIGQRLFLSHRTIGSHLYRIFPKLGITSRGELALALTPG